jgi:hypothetical protein
MTPARAVLVGSMVVNGPVLLLLFGPSAIVWWLGGAPKVIHAPLGLRLALSFGLSVCVAWLWWSVAIPRWRIWAFERVSDLPKLKQMAVAARLTWPEGSVFERTEIKSPGVAAREARLLEDQSNHQQSVSPNNRWRGP